MQNQGNHEILLLELRFNFTYILYSFQWSFNREHANFRVKCLTRKELTENTQHKFPSLFYFRPLVYYIQ